MIEIFVSCGEGAAARWFSGIDCFVRRVIAPSPFLGEIEMLPVDAAADEDCALSTVIESAP